ncbi:MAG TPA: hypothetical protein VFC25_18110 [Verrucomicrobiae bacterium]|nr:hypothetical protein [Verrucomicrobiae bacterium]
MKKTVLFLSACLVALPLLAADSGHPDHKSTETKKSGDAVTVKSTVEAIDPATRTVTFKDQDGDLVTVQAGSDIGAFDSLKVGERATFKYVEGRALQIRPADEADTMAPRPASGYPEDESDTPSSAPQTPSGMDTPSGAPTPGTPTKEPGAPGGGAGSGAASPSGTNTGSLTQQVTSLVTVKDVDPSERSISFETDDGRTMTVKVDDQDLLDNVKAGDRVEITYTNALLLSVKPSHK